MKLSLRTSLILGSVAAPLVMALSAPAGCTKEQVDTAVTTAVNTGCAVAAEIEAAKISLTVAEQTALAASTGFCPPNPAPTTVSAALQDFVADVPILLQAYAQVNPAKAAKLRRRYMAAMRKTNL